jgi:iron-sulfur cluster assembly protein
MPVTVTENAAKEIAAIIKQQDLDPGTIRLRVGVKGGGCSGFSYLLDLTEHGKDSDESWEYQYKDGDNGEEHEVAITVVCDPKSYLYLNGTVIDFKDEIMGRGFVFNNPNATTTCGCGSSFSA